MGPRKTTTRERLITTAAELFWRQGYAQTGVNRIIQEAHATSGSFYHFFPAKEDLLVAVVDHIVAVFETEVFADDDVDGDPMDRIFAILDRYRRNVLGDRFPFGSPLGGLSAEASENHPQVQARLAEVFAAWTNRIEDLLVDAGDRLPARLDRSALAQCIVCAMEGAALGARLTRSLAPFDTVVAELRNHVTLLESRPPVARAVQPPAVPARPVPPRAQPRAADWKSW
jgi:TetR/AcrR family transcriptional repressor of nem operon